jgi:hypothetical protein
MTNNVIEKLKANSSHGRTNKIIRFLLNVLSSTPIFGGVFSATASAWSEQEQTDINKLVVQLLEITDEKVEVTKTALVSMTNKSHIVAGYITFNPNAAEFIEASDISSLTDNGTLDFTISFSRPFTDYVFNYYGSGPTMLRHTIQTPNGVRVVFQEPAPDRVTIVFFEQQSNPALNRTRKNRAPVS